MSYHIVIPARYASTRLPGKPLLDVAGKPLLQRVYEQALKTQAKSVTIATDDQRILDFANGCGFNVEMTAQSHPSGTDRINEVCQKKGWQDDEIIVNLQGDEPLMPPQLPDQVATNLAEDNDATVATLCTPIHTQKEQQNPNHVKVVFDQHQHALYFSRAPIPFDRDANNQHHGHRHIGLYAYRAGFLRTLSQTPPCPLEQLEKLEQLRVMWLGKKIHVAIATDAPGPGVDTEEDLRVVNALF